MSLKKICRIQDALTLMYHVKCNFPLAMDATSHGELCRTLKFSAY